MSLDLNNLPPVGARVQWCIETFTNHHYGTVKGYREDTTRGGKVIIIAFDKSFTDRYNYVEYPISTGRIDLYLIQELTQEEKVQAAKLKIQARIKRLWNSSNYVKRFPNQAYN